MSGTGRVGTLTEGMPILFGGDRYTTVDAALAAAFTPGDRLYVTQDTGALLHVPAGVQQVVTAEVDAAVTAFAQLRHTPRDRIRDFFLAFARRLAQAWEPIALANDSDVRAAERAGRSTTRLRADEQMRDAMIAGLNGWAESLHPQTPADPRTADTTIDHGSWDVTVQTAPLGVIGFVFEGRPNVFADAAGVLASGNTAVLRIGSDALGTAHAILAHALAPALEETGMPAGAIRLVPTPERAAGWALFSDPRLALAVIRGSGTAVAQLSAVARQAGIPVSAHGTGGAWLLADATADHARLTAAVQHSLDRKVCNTLNVAAVTADAAPALIPLILAAADEAAAARGGTAARVHIAAGSEQHLHPDELTRTIDVHRATGVTPEPRASLLPVERLGTEWEWEQTPELSIVVTTGLDEAIDLFNTHSPRFVATLIADDPTAHDHFRARIDAPFLGDGFTRWVDGQYALNQPELGLSNWENGRFLGRAGILTGADLTTRRLLAHHRDPHQHR